MYCIIGKRRYPVENNTQLLKGVLEFCVLKLISREPTYGYELSLIHISAKSWKRWAWCAAARCRAAIWATI